MLKHQKIIAFPNFGSRDERGSGTERSFILKNNQINVQLHSIKDLAEKNIVSTEDILLNKYTEFLDLTKFEKLRDKLDISLKNRL